MLDRLCTRNSHYDILNVFFIMCLSGMVVSDSSSMKVAKCDAFAIPHVTQSPPADSLMWASPFIFKGGVKHWAALRWSVSFFRENFGETIANLSRTPVTDTANGVLPYDHFTNHTLSVPLRQACDLINGNDGNVYYLHQLKMNHFQNELANDVDSGDVIQLMSAENVPHYIRNGYDVWENGHLWIGSKGTRSGLHIDEQDNLIALVHGGKTVIVYPPSDSKNLYSYPDVPLKSQVDPLHNVQRFPRMLRTNPQFTHLEPGDVLYLPRMWWHHIVSTNVSISMNWWFSSFIRDTQSEYLLYSTYAHFLNNSDAFNYVHQSGGPAMTCRMWFAGSRGFTEYAITKRMSHHSKRLFCPQSLAYFGGIMAQSKPPPLYMQNAYKTVTSSNPRKLSSCSVYISTQNMYQFRKEIRDTVLTKLLLLSKGRMLRHTDLYQGLADTLSVLLLTMTEGSPYLGCHFDVIFNVGTIWDFCEQET